MLEQLLNEHAGEITSLLGNKYGLNSQQASAASGTITQAVSGFLAAQMSSGKLDLSHVADLFNKNTPNQSNSLFSGLSGHVANALSGHGLPQDAVSKISSGGLDDVLKIFQGGKLGSLDMNSITSLVSSLGGSGGIGAMLGNLGGLFGKK